MPAVRLTVLTAWAYLLSLSSWAQTSAAPADSLPRNFHVTGQPHVVPRVSLVVQRKPFVEVGLIRHWVQYAALGIASQGPYAAVDVYPGRNFIVGPKVGYSFGANAASLEAALSYYTNFAQQQLMFTPSVGVGVGGFVNVLYGYNVPLTRRRLDEVGGHRIGLVGNLNWHTRREYDQLVRGRVKR